MKGYFGSFQIGRMLILRSLAGIYIIAFISAFNQFPTLLGENGFLPATDFIKHVSFKQSPSLFHFYYSDILFAIITWIGILLSTVALIGFSEKWPWWISMCLWLVIWVIYLSIVNVGQVFYGFGWESMLLEAGFFAAFLGSSRVAASLIPILIFRWMLFRIELGAGLIKLRSDPCWGNLTCLYYHYETQPLPNPLSWFFHQLPQWFQRFSVFFSHIVQVVLPFGLLAPQRIALFSGLLIILHQLLLIISGNYSWLNWLTVILGFSVFSDSFFELFSITSLTLAARSLVYNLLIYLLAAFTIILSIQPMHNFFSKHQLMNYSFNPFHLVGCYGAFGSITKQRYEIVIEGTDDLTISPQSLWKEYEFRAKPGDIKRRPPQIAPYHLRLDWLMWFLPFSVTVTPQGIRKPGYELWFLHFVRKLLEGDVKTLRLLRSVPFSSQPPRFIRAKYYLYQFTHSEEKKSTGAWWRRTFIDTYLPPVSLTELGNV